MKIVNKIKKNFYTEKIYIFLIFFFTILMRLPYFSGHISGDEDTYIILGNWISKGGLPEVGLSDGKPATPFFIYAAIISIFGKSIIFFRLVASVFVSLASILIYLISKNYYSKNSAFISAIFYSFLASYIIGNDVLQAFFTDHIAVFLILLSFYFLNKPSDKYKNFLIFGFLIGLSAQTRPNLIIVAIFSIFIPFFINKNKKKIIEIFLIILGGIISILPIFIIYSNNNHLTELYNSSIVAPMDYAKDPVSNSRLITFLKFIFNGLNLNLFYQKDFLSIIKVIISIYFFIISLIGFLLKFKNTNFINHLKNKKFFLLNYFLIFIFLSLVLANKDYPHHLIQISPFVIIYFIWFHEKYFSKNYNYFVTIVITIFCITLILNRCITISKHYLKTKDFNTGTCYIVKNYLDKINYNKNHNFYAFDCLILYVLYDKFPLDGLANPYYFSKNSYRHNILDSNLEKVFSEKTDYVITNTKYPLERIINKYTNWSQEKKFEFNLKYTLIKKIEYILIYKKIITN